MGVVDATDLWRGVASEWLYGCTLDCWLGFNRHDDVTGWNPLFELWQSGDVPTGVDASDGVSFTVYARSHGVDPLDVAVTGGLHVAGLRRAVLVTEDHVTWVALVDAPPDAWVSPTWTEGEDAGVGWYVEAAVARVMAYQAMDASGSWSRGDAVAAQACLDGTLPCST